VSPCFADVEIERRQVSLLIAAFHQRLRVERQIRSLRSLASFWPVALGMLLGAYAPFLSDLTASCAPWASTLLFPFSALVGERGLHLSWDTAQAFSQFLLYAQFPLEGLLVRIVLKRRADLFNAFGHVTCLHVFALLYLGLATGSLNQILGS
jgi:hypothetical protein